MPFRRALTALFLAPMVVPIVITAAGVFLFYSKLDLAYTYTGMILAHAVLGTPFVVVTVTAALTGLDASHVRASLSMGASPVTTFRRITVPLIAPGVITGALFAFFTSVDEVVVVLFMSAQDQITIPRLMWGGIRQNYADHPRCGHHHDPAIGVPATDGRMAAPPQRALSGDPPFLRSALPLIHPYQEGPFSQAQPFTYLFRPQDPSAHAFEYLNGSFDQLRV